MQCTTGDDARSGKGDASREQQQPEDGSGSGEGAASAFARMKSQLEHHARRKPPDDPGLGTRHDGMP